ncbi:hypothetical protein [Vitiosangium sp. GDMCC 1.1324]|uniref:hypothetical protein n=1 Tax=Vitiosangium sp. (strain GDMCC 1.1324) TaxID=2138576 RepID=UPI000D36E4A6|nr:hypothetical protein [Vitiosangium sp. GDMCC 1.1324]PTL83301.1 hypothetical protein DAT35_15035 [Vitiosangium sp. GDMCC 1.1324]
MNDWTPKPNPSAALAKLPLTPEEGFVLSRLDGATPVRHLTALTGFPPERIQVILARLVEHGAVLPAPTPTSVPPPAASGTRTAPPAEGEEPLPPEEEEAPEEDASAEAAAGNWRQLFERRLHPLPEDERAHMARAAEDPELSAFCFDPVPAVIKSVLENTRVGLAHARLIARHHHNPVGLEALCGRAAFASDAGVRRWLVRNPQLPGSLFRRLWSGRRLMEQYKVAMDRDVPEGTRRTAREVMRTRFNTAPAEERVELILNTEGRVLASLVGLAVDGKTAALLCGRTYRSPMLIQNIARWSAAPPVLIAHLLKQEAVRRQPQLRMLLQRHPNAPADARKGG